MGVPQAPAQSHVAYLTHKIAPPERAWEVYRCPALNCEKTFYLNEVLGHAQEVHSVVVSDTPTVHVNSIEVAAADLEDDVGAAAWAPTLLNSFSTAFFFETWRNPAGRW